MLRPIDEAAEHFSPDGDKSLFWECLKRDKSLQYMMGFEKLNDAEISCNYIRKNKTVQDSELCNESRLILVYNAESERDSSLDCVQIDVLTAAAQQQAADEILKHIVNLFINGQHAGMNISLKDYGETDYIIVRAAASILKTSITQLVADSVESYIKGHERLGEKWLCEHLNNNRILGISRFEFLGEQDAPEGFYRVGVKFFYSYYWRFCERGTSRDEAERG